MNVAHSYRQPVFFWAALLIVCASCHKSSPPAPPSPYFLHCTIDGKDIKFDSDLVAIKQYYSVPGLEQNFISVSGNTGRILGQDLEFGINNGSTPTNNIPALHIGPGSYGVTNPYFQTDLIYDSAGLPNSYIADGTGAAPDTSNFLTINITALDSTSLKGNFSGRVYLDNNVGGLPPRPYGPQYKTITNGTFYLEWTK